ncbi:MAG: PilW family protein [Gammaproteobacteria bacterium]|nr:PilW family protein [Gammaproteobacteria bacterium]
MNKKNDAKFNGKTIYQSGFGLVEIMVALVIGLFLMTGVVEIFIGSKTTYKTTYNSSRIQENGRLAMELLSRDLRMAGYRGCLRSSMPVTNTLNNATSFNWNLDQDMQGFNASGTTWSPALPSEISSLQMLPGTDVITVRTIDSEDIYVTGQPSNQPACTPSVSSTADLKVTNNNFLKDDDIVLVSNCQHAAIFQITNFNTQENVVHNAGNTIVPGNSTKDLGGCLIGGEMMKISTKTYFIRTGSSGRPALWRRVATDSAQELVEGVENMQITYGIDSTGDRQANQYTTADTVNTNNWWPNVVSIRVSLLLQSIDDRITTQTQSYNYNAQSITATDRRLRQVFNTLISVRNRLP